MSDKKLTAEELEALVRKLYRELNSVVDFIDTYVEKMVDHTGMNCLYDLGLDETYQILSDVERALPSLRS